MRRNLPAAVPIWVLVAACMFGGMVNCESRDAGDNDNDNDKAVHAFRLIGLDGSRFYLADHRGKTVIMVFWSVRCVPCHRELMDLSKHALLRRPAVTVVSVCVDPLDRGLVEQGRRMSNGRIPVFLDSHGRLAATLGIKVEPTTLVIDQRGRERARIVGYDSATLPQIERHVALLEERQGR